MNFKEKKTEKLRPRTKYSLLIHRLFRKYSYIYIKSSLYNLWSIMHSVFLLIDVYKYSSDNKRLLGALTNK